MPSANCLENLRVRRFKGLADIELKRLGAFNLLLGANDVGKTSVLEAIFLLAGSSNPKLPLSIQNHRKFLVHSFDDLSYLFNDLDINTPIVIAAETSGVDKERKLSISVREDHSVADSPAQRIKNKGAENGTKNDYEEGSPDGFTSSFSSGPRILCYEAKVAGPRRKRPKSFKGELRVHSLDNIDATPPPADQNKVMIPARIVLPGAEYSGQTLADVVVNKMEGELLEILNCINPRIKRIAIKGNAAYSDIGLNKMLPLNMFGSGVIRAANILSHCLLGGDRVLLIDEIENGLHYEGILPFLKALLTLSARRGVQIFATAHSLEVLQGLQQVLEPDEYAEMRANTVCYVLARNKECAVVSYRYDYPQFDHCIENGIEIR